MDREEYERLQNDANTLIHRLTDAIETVAMGEEGENEPLVFLRLVQMCHAVNQRWVALVEALGPEVTG